ncbi:DNA-binding protein, 42 kDa [Fonsecaea nubica]|uniref:DNA-binding protein, 42 kDa n=1 Tax=Fonsecaea nubica TaxID=856822 RepID=A0A178CUJ1_9EURO|nr:DNA-binding protein, 42 kDa [Fonsecaea nubica]OAL32571.1 DNA-binding protein, 42 kDa [Fonsecaea nubica]
MDVFNAMRSFLADRILSPSPNQVKSGGPDTPDDSGSPTSATENPDDLVVAELTNVAALVELSVASGPQIASERRRSNAYFRPKYRQFRSDICMSKSTWEEYPWLAFDMFKWTETYRVMQDTGRLPKDQDHGPLPQYWTLFTAMVLYVVLLQTKRIIDCITEDIQTRLNGFPNLPSVPLRARTVEMRQLGVAKRHIVRCSEAFNRLLENMTRELSVALGEINKESGSVEAGEY